MGKGAAKPCIGTILLPISSNMEQDETDGPENRLENDTTPTPVPSVGSST